MAEERRAATRHTVLVDERENISVTGVLDVVSFDEEAIIAETEKGLIILRGANLHVNRLNLDNGELDIDGEVNSITYEDHANFAKGKPSIFNKLFR